MNVSILQLDDALNATSSTTVTSKAFDIFDLKTDDCTQICSLWNEMKKKKHWGHWKKDRTTPFLLEELNASAERGCGSCKFLEALLEGLLLSHSEIHGQESTFRWISFTFILEVVDKGRDKNWKFQFFSPKGSNTKIVYMPVPRLLTGDTSSTVSFDRARKLLKSCESSHGACDLGRDLPLPKRLVDLTPIYKPDGTSGVKLVETEGKTGTYACLSHCWGSPAHIQTKTSTTSIKEYMDFIPWGILTRTFQDAIEIARRLDIWYIWIDSLCIIQDSNKDWELESSKMGDIYRNSYITIAAVASTDSRGGCFYKTLPDICLKIVEEDGLRRSHLIGIRDCDSTWQPPNVSGHRMTSAVAADSPLYSRAWVYQERMLSRRILHCTRSELMVGCRAELICECEYPRAAPHLQARPPSSDLIGKLKIVSSIEAAREAGATTLGGRTLDQNCHEVWRDIVMAYSKLRLTVEHDKLPALSACAHLMAKAAKSEYLAGIWRSSLMVGLLWYVLPPRMAPRPKWRAPTWSWASVDAPNGVVCVSAGIHGAIDTFEGKIEAAETVLAGVDSMGRVNSGFIRLKACLGGIFLRVFCKDCTRTTKSGMLFAVHTTNEPTKRLNRANEICTFSVTGIDVRDAIVSFYGDIVPGDIEKATAHRSLNRTTNGCMLVPLALLYIPKQPRVVRAGVETISDHFVVLTKCPSQVETYERVGLLAIAHKSAASKNAWFEEVWPKVITKEKTITLI